MSPRFVERQEVAERFCGKRVALVGSGPTVLRNASGLIDSHDIVVRVSDYELRGPETGARTDVHYSFYGTSIRKRREELMRDGVRLCMSKLPNAKALDCAWHERNGNQVGTDYRYIYRNRAHWWFCDTYVPTVEVFLEKFRLLGDHQPTTGFAAFLDLLSFDFASLYITGFDFFTSGLRCVDRKWKPGNPDDPIKHMPELEAQLMARYAREQPQRIVLDDALRERFSSSANAG